MSFAVTVSSFYSPVNKGPAGEQEINPEIIIKTKTKISLDGTCVVQPMTVCSRSRDFHFVLYDE